MKINKILFAAVLFLSLQLPAAGGKKPLWKIQLPGEIAGSPAVCGNTAVVVTKDGTLCALDNAGKMVWKQKLPSGCLAPPAVNRNGDIYVACADGSLLRLSAAGKPIWQIRLEQQVLATPLLAAETLFVVSGEGEIFKIRQKDGAILKKSGLNLMVHSSPVWDAGKQNLLVPIRNSLFLALSQELRVLWKFKTSGVNLSVPAVTPKNEIYLTSMDHHLYKLNAAGQLLWKFKAKGWLKASPVVDDRGRAYFGSYGRCFYAINGEGKPQWQFQGKAQFTSGAALDAAGNLYCGDTSGTVYALDSRGKLLWQYKSDDFITADLTIMPEKILLAGSIDGTLLAFRTEQPLSKKAWWAKYLGNLANSGFDEL